MWFKRDASQGQETDAVPRMMPKSQVKVERLVDE